MRLTRRNCGGTPNALCVAHQTRARTPTARDIRILWWNGNDRAWLRTTIQESPRGAESARDTDDVLLGLAMARRVTPIRRGATHPSLAQPAYLQADDRCTSIASFPRSRKHDRTPGLGPDPSSRVVLRALRHDRRRITVPRMPAAPSLKDRLANIVAEYNATANPQTLRDQLHSLVSDATPDALIAAAEPHRDEPEIIAPIYEAVVSAQPDNARAIVILANAYWLQGRGPQVVGELATKAISVDPANRGAWHLWALSESSPRDRVRRWQQVSERFPEDHLALAAMADNAASVAGAEQDYGMLDVAIATYESLLQKTTEPTQRDALTTALSALRGWRF